MNEDENKTDYDVCWEGELDSLGIDYHIEKNKNGIVLDIFNSSVYDANEAHMDSKSFSSLHECLEFLNKYDQF